jgi:hypothetical protein
MITSATPPTFVNVVASTSPDDFNINFNKATNTLFASLTVKSDILAVDGATSAYHIGFGDLQTPANKSAYIDNVHYAAIETPGGTSVDSNGGDAYGHAESTAYLASGAQLGVTNFFPETFGAADGSGNPQPFCDNCDFMQWGAWGARFGFGETSSRYVDNVQLGWWIAGDISTAAQLNALAIDPLQAQGAMATFDGHAIGNVANNIDGSGWKTYVAAGNLNMNWSFAERSGDLTISKFDTSVTPEGLTFTGQMSSPGVADGNFTTPEGNHFGGQLTGQLPNDLGSLSGNAAGSFVNNGNAIAAGVIGNWNVGNSAYRATGIFAGGLAPK